jgi:hypothetical protein
LILSCFNANEILVEKPQLRRSSGRYRYKKKNCIKMDFKDAGFKTWTLFKWFRMGPVAGFCEHSHEL